MLNLKFLNLFNIEGKAPFVLVYMSVFRVLRLTRRLLVLGYNFSPIIPVLNLFLRSSFPFFNGALKCYAVVIIMVEGLQTCYSEKFYVLM